MGLYALSFLVLLLLGLPALIWLAVAVRSRLLARGAPSGPVYCFAAAAVALLPLGLFEMAVALWATVTYDGTCYGFTDGHWPCSRADFTAAQASYGLLLLIPLAAFHLPATLLVFLLGWRRRHFIDRP